MLPMCSDGQKGPLKGAGAQGSACVLPFHRWGGGAEKACSPGPLLFPTLPDPGLDGFLKKMFVYFLFTYRLNVIPIKTHFAPFGSKLQT